MRTMIAMSGENPEPRKSPSFKGYKPASEAASRAKRSNRKRDTRHEVLLRRELWKIGCRYRKHLATLRGNPDIVFPSARVVVFCDGDYWHGRDWEHLRAALTKRHNAEYWIAKIERNRERDKEHTASLTGDGWLVLRFWEGDILRDPRAIAQQIGRLVAERKERTL